MAGHLDQENRPPPGGLGWFDTSGFWNALVLLRLFNQFPNAARISSAMVCGYTNIRV